MKSIDLNPNKIAPTISRFLRRYHLLIYVLLTGLALGYVIFFYNDMMNTASNVDGVINTTSDPGFDKKTIERIKDLKASADYEPVAMPGGRTNPFYE